MSEQVSTLPHWIPGGTNLVEYTVLTGDAASMPAAGPSTGFGYYFVTEGAGAGSVYVWNSQSEGWVSWGNVSISPTIPGFDTISGSYLNMPPSGPPGGHGYYYVTSGSHVGSVYVWDSVGSSWVEWSQSSSSIVSKGYIVDTYISPTGQYPANQYDGQLYFSAAPAPSLGDIFWSSGGVWVQILDASAGGGGGCCDAADTPYDPVAIDLFNPDIVDVQTAVDATANIAITAEEMASDIKNNILRGYVAEIFDGDCSIGVHYAYKMYDHVVLTGKDVPAGGTLTIGRSYRVLELDGSPFRWITNIITGPVAYSIVKDDFMVNNLSVLDGWTGNPTTAEIPANSHGYIAIKSTGTNEDTDTVVSLYFN